MRILCITCMNDRPQVSAIFMTGMRRLGIEVLAAVSTNEDIEVCERYGADYLMIDNNPLGNKWNMIATHAVANYEFSHLLVSGDDNVYSNDILRLWTEAKSCNFVGLSSVYFVSPQSQLALLFKYATTPPLVIGTGRLINRSLFLYYKKGEIIRLFAPEANRQLDHSNDMFLLEKGYYPTVIDTGGVLCVDIKTNKNIWQFDNFKHTSSIFDYQTALSIIPEGERNMINQL